MLENFIIWWIQSIHSFIHIQLIKIANETTKKKQKQKQK